MNWMRIDVDDDDVDDANDEDVVDEDDDDDGDVDEDDDHFPYQNKLGEQKLLQRLRCPDM